MTIESEILELTEQGRDEARLAELAKNLETVFVRMEPAGVARACGKIIGLLNVSDTESVAVKVLSTTESDLKRMLGG